MFEKSRKDAYDLIIGWNILSEIWLNILYDTHQFEWNDIKVNMVPGGHWSKENISSFWKKFKAAQEEEANLTEIKSAEYKVTDITEVVNAQQHLTLAERNKLKSMLTKFQFLFMGQRGKYKGPPVELELLPDSKPYYGKPVLIPQAYLKVTLKMK
jgi:hypothetical protein